MSERTISVDLDKPIDRAVWLSAMRIGGKLSDVLRGDLTETFPTTPLEVLFSTEATKAACSHGTYALDFVVAATDALAAMGDDPRIPEGERALHRGSAKRTGLLERDAERAYRRAIATLELLALVDGEVGVSARSILESNGVQLG